MRGVARHLLTKIRTKLPQALDSAVCANLRYRVVAVVGFFTAFAAAAFLRLSDVCAPYFFVNRSTRPSVSISFCRPVKNG